MILGLSAYAHDSAAAVVRGGQVTACCEEERLDRVKHSGAFPHRAIAATLAGAGVTPADVDRVAFFLRPDLVQARVRALAADTWPRGALEWARNGRSANALEPRLRRDLAAAGLGRVPCDFVEHHQAHAVSAVAASGFDRCAILTADGKGEWATTTLGRALGGRVSVHEEIRYPHSLGYLYSVLTRFLGFRPWGGEGKVMGLASYGDPARFRPAVEQLCPAEPDGTYRLDLRFFRHHLGLPWVGPRLVRLLGAPTHPGTPPTERDQDLAAALQAVLEERLVALARRLRRKSGERALVCAGGVFLNGCANWRLRVDGGFDTVFAHPVSHDAGAALGAAQAVAAEQGDRPCGPLGELFLGPDLHPDTTEAACRASGWHCARVPDPAAEAARLLADGHVVGWVQGPSEVGPRALGARSILADPRPAAMKDTVNARVKRREGFRPFAPAVLAERCAEWFVDPGPFRYMIVVVPVRPERAASIAAVTHVDGTGRVQTVHADTNPLFHRCIDAFAARTGVPVVLNTSFNLRGEPMVQTAADALDCMRRTELDHCVIGDWHVAKHAPRPR